MTLRAVFFGLFPAVHVCLIGAALFGVVAAPGPGSVAALLAVIYLLPLALYRVHDALWPLQEGRTSLVGGGYNPWWGASQLQWTFSAFPVFERVLMAFPGALSAWFRAWGSRIGRGVVWTPDLVVLDRGMLDIGDGVVIGYQVGLSAHLVTGSGKDLVLVVARNTVGRKSLIGAGGKLMPGCRVGERVVLGADNRVGAFAVIGDGVRTGAMCWIDHKVVLDPGTRLRSGEHARATTDDEAAP